LDEWWNINRLFRYCRQTTVHKDTTVGN